MSKMLTVNWQVKVGFECNFSLEQALAAIRSARIGKAGRDHAVDTLERWFEVGEIPLAEKIYLTYLIAGEHCDLLPAVSDRRPDLYREAFGETFITDMQVTEPVREPR